jgi:hypothetical protein
MRAPEPLRAQKPIDLESYELTAAPPAVDRKSRPFAAPPPPRPTPAQPSLIGPQNTVAGNPAQLTVRFAQYARCNRRVLLVAAVVALGLLAVAPFYKPWLMLALLVVIPPLLLREEFVKAREKFHRGDLVAAKVLSERPYLVASYADLSTGRGGPKYAIDVRYQPLAQRTGGAPSTGDRVAAVALYYGSVNNDAWDEFSPTVINTACADERQITRAVASIDPADWSALDRGLARLPADVKPGLYRLWEAPAVGGALPRRENMAA